MTPYETFLALLSEAARRLDGNSRVTTGNGRELRVDAVCGCLAADMADAGSLSPWLGEPLAVAFGSATGIPVRAFALGDSMKIGPGSAVRIATGLTVGTVPDECCWMFVPREMPLTMTVLDAEPPDGKTWAVLVPGFPRPVKWHVTLTTKDLGGRDGRIGAGFANYSPDRDFWLSCGDLLGWLVCVPDDKEWFRYGWRMFRELSRLMKTTYDFGRMKEANG